MTLIIYLTVILLIAGPCLFVGYWLGRGDGMEKGLREGWNNHRSFVEKTNNLGPKF